MSLEENLAFFWCLALFQEETVKLSMCLYVSGQQGGLK